jgi:hypothetical protein
MLTGKHGTVEERMGASMLTTTAYGEENESGAGHVFISW